VTSRVDRCNSLLAGVLACLLDGLQSVLNAAARLVCNRRKYDYVTPLLCDVLHWLPVPFHIKYKLCLLVFLSLHGAAPEYLRDCCTGTHSSASGLRLRLLERTDLRVRRMKTHFRDRAFSAASPRCWNSLPPVIGLADSVDSFKAQLKTHLFATLISFFVRRPCSGMAALLRHISCHNYYYYYLSNVIFIRIFNIMFLSNMIFISCNSIFQNN